MRIRYFSPDEGSPSQDDFAGYPNLEELKKGYLASGSEAKKWREAASKSEERIGRLEQAIDSLMTGNQRQAVPQRHWTEQLQELGVDPNPIREGIREESRQYVQEFFEPIARGVQARGKVIAEYPDYNQFESEISAFINSDPELSQKYTKMFNADPLGAMEFAYLKYGSTKRQQAPVAGNGVPEQRRAEAQIPTTRAGDARNQSATNREPVRQGWEHFQKTGNPQAFFKARLREVIPDSFFQQ